MASHLSLELRRIMRRELKDMGENILKKQCMDLGIDWADIEVSDISKLSAPLSKAISTFTGREKADKIIREIEKFKVLEELASVGEVGERVGRKKRIEALNRLGGICHLIGEWENSLRYYTEAADLAKAVGDRALGFEIGTSMGLVLLEMGRCEEARGKLEAMLDEATAAMDAEAAASANRGLGKVMWRMGRFDMAVDYCRRAIEHYKAVNDSVGLAYLYKDLGDAYGEKGEFGKGLEYYSKSLAMFDARTDAYSIANVHMNIGVVYSMMKDWEKAVENYETCISITGREGYLNTMAWALFNVAEAYTKLKQLDKAEKALDRSAEMLKKTDDTMGMAGVEMKFGELLQAKGEWREAVPHFEACIKTLRELGIQKYLADVLHELGLTQAHLARKKEARASFQEALGIYKKLEITAAVEKTEADLEKLGPEG